MHFMHGESAEKVSLAHQPVVEVVLAADPSTVDQWIRPPEAAEDLNS
jgi:hypothetical protein